MTDLSFLNNSSRMRCEAIEHGFRIVPVCPYVKAWLQKHDDYAPHAIAVEPRHLEAAKARQHSGD